MLDFPFFSFVKCYLFFSLLAWRSCIINCSIRCIYWLSLAACLDQFQDETFLPDPVLNLGATWWWEEKKESLVLGMRFEKQVIYRVSQNSCPISWYNTFRIRGQTLMNNCIFFTCVLFSHKKKIWGKNMAPWLHLQSGDMLSFSGFNHVYLVQFYSLFLMILM